MIWGDNTTGYEALPKKISKYCPVCPKEEGYLGKQEDGREVSLHCPDCRAVYTWFPGVEKPSSTLDKDIPEVCTCPNCKLRRGEE